MLIGEVLGRKESNKKKFGKQHAMTIVSTIGGLDESRHQVMAMIRPAASSSLEIDCHKLWLAD